MKCGFVSFVVPAGGYKVVFATGAGHGNTFQDLHGNWWNTGTAWVAVNWNFERRIVMHPAGFDADGDMYADTLVTLVPDESFSADPSR